MQGNQVPAVEVLLNSALIADLIKNDQIEKIREAIEQSVSQGSQTFEQALYKLFKSGEITKEEALLNADSASNLASHIDYSQTSQVKAYDPNDKPSAPVSAPSANFDDIKLDLKTPGTNR